MKWIERRKPRRSKKERQRNNRQKTSPKRSTFGSDNKDEEMREPLDRDISLDVMAKLLGQKRAQDTSAGPPIPLLNPAQDKQHIAYLRTRPNLVSEKAIIIPL